MVTRASFFEVHDSRVNSDCLQVRTSCDVLLSLSRGHANFMKRLRPYSRDATLSFFQVEFSRWPCNAEKRQPVGSQNKRTRLNLDW